MKNTYALTIFLVSLLHVPSISQTWNSVGPYGGWINVLTKDVSGNIYAGTYLGGIFRTSNNGDTWLQIYNDTLIIDALSIAFNSSGHIFVGASPGFHRSTNGGASWQKINNALNTRTVESMVVLSNDNILAGNWGGNGVYRSTDNGTTFATTNNGLTNTQVRFLVLKPGNGYVFAGTYGGGVFRSTDGGTNWSAVNNGIPGTSLMNWVGVSPSGDIYGTAGTTMYRSTNNGDNWTNLAPPPTVYNEIAFAPTAMYAATSSGDQGSAYKSTNGGTTWTPENGLPNKIFTRIMALGGTIVAGTGGLGTYRSNGTDSPNDTWTQVVNGMTNTHIVGIDEAPNGDLFAATLLAGVFRSTNAGLTWSSASNGIPPSDRLSGLAVSTTTGTVFAGGVGFRGFRSTDQGATWTIVNQLAGASTVACNSRGHVFAGSGSFVRRSTNDGITWTGTEPSSQISRIAELAFDGDTVYAATGVGSGFGASRGVYRSTDNGSTWVPFNNGLTNLNVTTITARDTDTTLQNAEASVLSTRLVLCGTQGSGTFKLTSAQIDERSLSEIWETCGPSEGDVRQFFIKDAAAFFCCHLVLSLFGDFHEFSWQEEDCEVSEITLPPYVEPTKAQVLPPHSTMTSQISPILLLGTNGSGIYRSLNAISSVGVTSTSPDRFLLKQNYPNPFNPSTRIVYTVKSRELVSLKVFDVLGREVATLIDEVKDPGEHSVTLDAVGMSSGVYFYRLHSGEFTQTKKLMLLR